MKPVPSRRTMTVLGTLLAAMTLASALLRLTGRRRKVRYPVPPAFEPLLAQHFVWRFERT